MRKITIPRKAEFEVVECESCGAEMVNIDENQLLPGDLVELRKQGIRISNPNTEEKICINCEVKKEPSIREKLADFFESDEEDDNDDSGFFGGFGGGGVRSGSGFGGGSFGGFGGGGFSGGGASRSF